LTLCHGAEVGIRLQSVKYCSECAGNLSFKIPPKDTVSRYICDDCQKIFYQNPRIVVGTLPRWEDKVLLCKRSIEPRLGFWTLPSGYLENGETVEEGAIRETEEEAGARVSIVRLFAVYSLPHVSQVYQIFLADLEDLEFEAGEESLEVELFSEERVPWDQIAFRAIVFSLERYFADKTPERVHLGAFYGKRKGSW
jgi:ADP-ribose pyrophosphatase YjhB (NUDIX family)